MMQRAFTTDNTAKEAEFCELTWPSFLLYKKTNCETLPQKIAHISCFQLMNDFFTMAHPQNGCII